MNNKPLVIGVGSSLDGRAALWALEWSSPGGFDYHLTNYAEDPPPIKDRVVILLGVWYPRTKIEQMAKEAKAILAVDNKSSTQEEIKRYTLPPNVNVVAEYHIGLASLTWKQFNKDQPVPYILDLINDYVNWRFLLPDTKPVISAILADSVLSKDLKGHTFPYFNMLVQEPFKDQRLIQLRTDGIPIERYKQSVFETIMESGVRNGWIGDYRVPIANVPYVYASEICNMLAKGQKFAVVYSDGWSKRRYELRSDANGLDVSRIAKLYGGGGHVHSAGFRIPFTHELVVSNHAKVKGEPGGAS